MIVPAGSPAKSILNLPEQDASAVFAPRNPAAAAAVSSTPDKTIRPMIHRGATLSRRVPVTPRKLTPLIGRTSSPAMPGSLALLCPPAIRLIVRPLMITGEAYQLLAIGKAMREI